MTRVLLVDDDALLVRALAMNLRARGLEVETAADGTTALREAALDPPDLAIVDLGLPDMDGVDVVAALRSRGPAPIIVLSARDSEPSKVDALDAGADDYVTKPFGMEELLARVRAALRRSSDAAATVDTATFSVDIGARQVVREGEVVRLTPTEWHVLEVLARRPGTLVTQTQLLREVWGAQYENETNYLRVYLAQLRRKLEVDPSRPRHLITEPGMGYRFEV